MDVDTRSFELLEAIASDGTLTAAAQRLHVSQPALSQRLTGLEARLGLRLFDREGRRLTPTRAGRRMIHAAAEVLGELRAADRDLDDLRNGRQGTLRLASQCSTNYQWLPPIIHAYAEAFPGVEVRIETVPADEPVAALLADRIDVGLVRKPDRRMDAVLLHALFEDEMVAVVPVGHPWAERPFVEAADFDGVHLILFDSYDQTRTPALALPIPSGSTPGRITTTPVVSELVVELVAADQGIAVLPGWVATPYLAGQRITTVRISETPEVRTWYCATRRGDDQSRHVDGFVQLLRHHFSMNPPPNTSTAPVEAAPPWSLSVATAKPSARISA